MRLLASSEHFRPQAGPPLRELLEAGGAAEFLTETRRQRLTALAGSRAIELIPGAGSQALQGPVERARDANRARALGLEALALRIVKLLEAQEIRALPLKGPFLARRVHGDAGLRVVNDLDILVAKEQIETAVAAIRDLGYVADDPPWTTGLPDLHYVLRHPANRLPRVEVHWRVHWYEERFSRDMLERSSTGRDGLPTAEKSDELAALLLFYARDGFYGLRIAADIVAWWERFGAGDEPLLQQHWDAYPDLRRPLGAAGLTVQRVVGLPAQRLLPPAETKGMRLRLASRLANWPQQGEYDQLVANIGLIDGLLAPNRDLGHFSKRYMLLSRHEIADVYHLDSPYGLRARVWQILHPPKIAMRYLLGMIGNLLPRRDSRLSVEMGQPPG